MTSSDGKPWGLDLPDIMECVETPEMVLARLEEIEGLLAARLGLVGEDIRGQLFALDQANELVEDELVADWHSQYSTWKHTRTEP